MDQGASTEWNYEVEEILEPLNPNESGLSKIGVLKLVTIRLDENGGEVPGVHEALRFALRAAQGAWVYVGECVLLFRHSLRCNRSKIPIKIITLNMIIMAQKGFRSRFDGKSSKGAE